MKTRRLLAHGLAIASSLSLIAPAAYADPGNGNGGPSFTPPGQMGGGGGNGIGGGGNGGGGGGSPLPVLGGPTAGGGSPVIPTPPPAPVVPAGIVTPVVPAISSINVVPTGVTPAIPSIAGIGIGNGNGGMPPGLATSGGMPPGLSGNGGLPAGLGSGGMPAAISNFGPGSGIGQGGLPGLVGDILANSGATSGAIANIGGNGATGAPLNLPVLNNNLTSAITTIFGAGGAGNPTPPGQYGYGIFGPGHNPNFHSENAPGHDYDLGPGMGPGNGMAYGHGGPLVGGPGGGGSGGSGSGGSGSGGSGGGTSNPNPPGQYGYGIFGPGHNPNPHSEDAPGHDYDLGPGMGPGNGMAYGHGGPDGGTTGGGSTGGSTGGGSSGGGTGGGTTGGSTGGGSSGGGTGGGTDGGSTSGGSTGGTDGGTDGGSTGGGSTGGTDGGTDGGGTTGGSTGGGTGGGTGGSTGGGVSLSQPVEIFAPAPPEFRLPFSSPQIISTDTIRWRWSINPREARLALIRLSDKLADAGMPWVVSTFRPQPYAFENDGQSLILATPGTIFAVTGDHTVTLKEGSIVVLAGNRNAMVVTTYGATSIPSHSSAWVTQDRYGSVSVSSLTGQDSDFNVNHRGETANLKVASGNELHLSGSRIAAAGISDFVPVFTNGDTAITGLSMSNRKANASASGYGEPVACCETGDLSPAMKNNLAALRRALKDSGKQLPPSCEDSSSGSVQLQMTPISYPQLVTTKSDVMASEPGSESNIRHFMATTAVKIDGARLIAMAGSKIEESAAGTRIVAGEVLADASKTIKIKVKDHELELKRGSIALITVGKNTVKIHNLHESSGGAMSIGNGSRSVPFRAGQEIILGDHSLTGSMASDGIARRRIQMLELADGSHSAMTEFSMVSLFHNSKAMRHLLSSQDREDRATSERVIKMGACLMHVTSSRGSYQHVANSGSIQ